MGSLVPIIPGIPDFYILDLCTFNNRLFCISRAINTPELQKIFRLNLSENAWEELVSFTPNTNVNKFFIHKNSLYVYSCGISDAEIYKLNNTQDMVDLVIGGPSSGYLYYKIFSWGDHFYNGIYRSNISEDAWEEVYPGIAIEITESVQGLIEFNSLLYFVTDTGFYKYNETMDGITFICTNPSWLSFPYGLYVFNNKLYYAGIYEYYILKEIETEGFDLLGNYSFSTNIFRELDSRLYIIGGNGVYRLESDNSLLHLGFNNLLTGSDILNSKMYLTDGTQLSIYSPIRIDDEKRFGVVPFSVNLAEVIISDYPILSCEWDFGDGSPHSFEETPVHTYNTVGFYTVTVSVTTNIYSNTYILTDFIEVVPQVHRLVHSIEALQAIGSSEEWPDYGDYELANDIDASGTITWNSGKGFTPISFFRGSLNGANYTISNLYINRPDEALVGIFSRVNGADFLNLNIMNIEVHGNSRVAALIGSMQNPLGGYFETGGTITNCNINGAIYTENVGSGIAAEAINYTFTNTSFSGTVYCGYLGEPPVDGYYSAYNYFYRLIGGIAGYSESVTFSNCQVTNSTLSGCSGGGLTGRSEVMNAINCTVSDTIMTLGYNGGGLVGSCFGGESTIQMCTTSGVINSNEAFFRSGNIGGLIGYSDTVSVSNCATSFEISLSNLSHGYGIGGLVGSAIYRSFEACSATGNINAPVGYNDVGGLVGHASWCNFIECFTDNEIIGSTYVGGLIGSGELITSSLSRCYTLGTVTGSYCVGGFIGSGNVGLIQDCFTKANVYYNENPSVTEPSYFGGFSGSLSINIVLTRCHSLGNVEGIGIVGGFSGQLQSSITITSCLSKGSTLQRQIPAFALGWVSNKIIGGFVGEALANLKDCFSSSAVDNTSDPTVSRNTGGLIGLISPNFSVVNCYSIGKVEA